MGSCALKAPRDLTYIVFVCRHLLDFPLEISSIMLSPKPLMSVQGIQKTELDISLCSLGLLG